MHAKSWTSVTSRAMFLLGLTSFKDYTIRPVALSSERYDTNNLTSSKAYLIRRLSSVVKERSPSKTLLWSSWGLRCPHLLNLTLDNVQLSIRCQRLVILLRKFLQLVASKLEDWDIHFISCQTELTVNQSQYSLDIETVPRLFKLIINLTCCCKLERERGRRWSDQ